MQMSSAQIARCGVGVGATPYPKSAIGFENALAYAHFGVGFDECHQQILSHRFRQRLAVPFRHCRFGIVQIQMTRSSFPSPTKRSHSSL